jgi:hypothetical protein
MLTDCYGFRVVGTNLRIVGKDAKGIYIHLNSHTLRAISGYTMKSVTFTICMVIIAFSNVRAILEKHKVVMNESGYSIIIYTK